MMSIVAFCNCRIISNINKLKILRIPSFAVHQTNLRNAGHSKWANIKHTKAEKDGKRAAMFTKLSRQIRLAIQDGGSTNPSINSTLKGVIEIAVKSNMPMATIQNTIKKCEQDKTQLKKHILEIKAFQKVYFVCILYSDNIPLVKMTMSQYVKKIGGSFVDARHLFDDSGVIEAIVNENVLNEAKTPEKIEEICTEDAIECGAEEVEIIDSSKGLVNFLCNPIELRRISNVLNLKGYKIESSEHVFVPKTYINISDDEMETVNFFISKLKAVDGIEEIYDNIHPDMR